MLTPLARVRFAVLFAVLWPIPVLQWVRENAGPFDFAQGRLSGTSIIFATFPALKRWAKLGHPSGASILASAVGQGPPSAIAQGRLSRKAREGAHPQLFRSMFRGRPVLCLTAKKGPHASIAVRKDGRWPTVRAGIRRPPSQPWQFRRCSRPRCAVYRHGPFPASSAQNSYLNR